MLVGGCRIVLIAVIFPKGNFSTINVCQSLGMEALDYSSLETLQY